MSRSKKPNPPEEAKQPAKPKAEKPPALPEAELLPPEVLEALQKVPEGPREEIAELILQAQIVRSPYLPPGFLRAHEEIYPGFQEDIYFPTLKAETEHRRAEESKNAAHLRTMETRGQIFAGLIGLLTVALAGTAACLGHAGAAAAVATPGFTLLGASYLVPKYLASKRSTRKSDQPSE